MNAREAFALDQTYVQLHDGPRADPVPVGPDFWNQIDQRTDLHAGRLVMAFHQTATWSHWEMHPAGDEVLFLISGAATVLLEEEEGERAVALTPGTACVVPQGIWHTARIDVPGVLLAITRGEGTQHRPGHPAEPD